MPEEGTAGDLQLFSHQKWLLGSEGSSWRSPGCSALVGPSCPSGVEGKAVGAPLNPKFLLEERSPEAGCPPQSQGHLGHSRHRGDTSAAAGSAEQPVFEGVSCAAVLPVQMGAAACKGKLGIFSWGNYSGIFLGEVLTGEHSPGASRDFPSIRSELG